MARRPDRRTGSHEVTVSKPSKHLPFCNVLELHQRSAKTHFCEMHNFFFMQKKNPKRNNRETEAQRKTKRKSLRLNSSHHIYCYGAVNNDLIQKNNNIYIFFFTYEFRDQQIKMSTWMHNLNNKLLFKCRGAI